ncbi:MAG: peptidoglycan-binding protein [Verrucomicrobiota bacterium]
MKRYLIFLLSVLFGLAQIVQAADPDDVRKGKQKAPQAVRHAQQHVGQPPAAFKKSSNFSGGMVGAPAYQQVNPQFQKNQRTFIARNSANVQAQGEVKPFRSYNPRTAAELETRKQYYINRATQQNVQNQTNRTFIGDQKRSGFNGLSQSSGLSFSDAYRRRHHEYHHRDWWRNHYGTNIVLFGGGYYYLDSGYWYPAYGYDPIYSSYEYDGPIYGYNNLPPGEVVTNVQSALQEQGYYEGEIDGSIGPLTRSALRRYQRDNGLEITAAIDEPTLASLGLI